MMTNGFKINGCDKCVYVKNTERGSVIICLYVDDMLVMGSNNEVIKTTKKMFNNKFNMKDLGVIDVILGIKISKTSDGLILSQSHYIEQTLKKFKQDDSSLMSAKLIYVLSSFHMLFCAFYIHIHVKLIKFPLNLVL